MVCASDGVKTNCGALLMTLELSKKIQDVVNAQREIDKSEQIASREDNANFDFENKLRSQIAQHEYRILVLGDHETAEAAAEADTLNDELVKLQLLLENTAARRQVIAANRELRSKDLRCLQAALSAMLEDAFVTVALLEPAADDPVESTKELDIEEEYQKICRMIQEDGEEQAHPVEHLHYFDEGVVPAAVSPEGQRLADPKAAYWDAQQEL